MRWFFTGLPAQYKINCYIVSHYIKRNTYRILKENRMEERMTDFQFNKLLQMVLEIMKSSKSLDEAIAKVERLTKKGA